MLKVEAQILFILGCLFLQATACAQTQYSEAGEVEDVYVTTTPPGPPLWQVKNGGNVLYIFGLLSPLPTTFDWDSARVDWVISQSREFIEHPRVLTGTDNPLLGPLVVRKLRRLKELPENQTLAGLTPEPLFEKYLAVAEQYTADEDEFEHLRPFSASEYLMNEALDSHDLTKHISITTDLGRIARYHEVPIKRAEIIIPINQALENFEQTSVESEIACLEATLASIETELPGRARLARAWSTGNAATLEAAEYLPLETMCFEEILLLGEYVEHIEEQWLEVASRALENNSSTFAVLTMNDIVNPDGLLARLLSRGFILED